MAGPPFDLWLDFEHPEELLEDGCCKMLITLGGGKKYAMTLWTAKCHSRVLMAGKPFTQPDLFVQQLDRTFLEKMVAYLISQGELLQLAREVKD